MKIHVNGQLDIQMKVRSIFVVVNHSRIFSYCKLHLLYAFQPKGKKDELIDKDNEVPKFIEKKIKSA